MKKALLFFTLFISLFSFPLLAKTDEGIEPIEVDNSIIIDRIGNDDITIGIPSPLFSFSEPEITVQFVNPGHTKLLLNKNKIEFIINGESKVLEFVDGKASFKHSFKDSNELTIFTEEFSFSKTVTVYPLWAIITPLILILLYILKRLFTKK